MGGGPDEPGTGPGRGVGGRPDGPGTGPGRGVGGGPDEPGTGPGRGVGVDLMSLVPGLVEGWGWT